MKKKQVSDKITTLEKHNMQTVSKILLINCLLYSSFFHDCSLVELVELFLLYRFVFHIYRVMVNKDDYKIQCNCGLTFVAVLKIATFCIIINIPCENTELPRT